MQGKSLRICARISQKGLILLFLSRKNGIILITLNHVKLVVGGHGMENLILKLPNITTKNYFTEDLLIFLFIIFSLVVGILLCFWGYKYFQTLMIIACGLFSGYLGVKIMLFLTAQPILQMCFFVVFTFAGCCFVYFIAVICSFIIKKIRIKKFLDKNLYLLTSILGAYLICFITFSFIYRERIVCILISSFISLIGLTCQKKNELKRPHFHCYDEIFKMKPLKEKETIDA